MNCCYRSNKKLEIKNCEPKKYLKHNCKQGEKHENEVVGLFG